MTIDVEGLARIGRRLVGPRRVFVLAISEDHAVVIGHADDGSPIVWPIPSREAASHILVVAASGAGKTLLVAHSLVLELLAHETGGREPIAILVIDPKGDLVAAILMALAALAPHRLRDVAVADPFLDAGGFAFNLNRFPIGATPLPIHALRIANVVSAVSTATGQAKHLGTGPRQVEMIQRALHGALAVPGGDVLLAVEAFIVRHGFRKLAAVTSDPRAREILENTYASDELKASCLSRLRVVFGAAPSLERMLSTPGCINFSDLLAPNKICLVDLGRPIGGLGALREFYANLIGRLAIDHLLARPSPSPEHHVRIVVDEAPVVSTLADQAEDLLTTGRSRNLSAVQITQGTTLMHDVDPTWVHVTVGNTPTKIVGRLGAPDAEHLAREQAPGRGVEESIGAIRGRFTAAVTNFSDREFYVLRPGGRVRFRAAELDLVAWRRAAEEHEAEIEATKRRLALPADLPARRSLDQLYAEQRPQPARAGRGRRAAVADPAPTDTPQPREVSRRPRSRWG